MYEGLPTDRPCVVDGKLATSIGPFYVGERPILSITLAAGEITSGLRVVKREKGTVKGVLGSAEGLLETVASLTLRKDHAKSMSERVIRSLGDIPFKNRGGHISIDVDTEKLSGREIIDTLFGRIDENEPTKSDVLAWETDALREAAATISYLNIALNENSHPANRQHFDHNFESLLYSMNRLQMHHDPAALAEIRGSIKKSLTDCWLGLMMKEMPRFFVDISGELSADNESHAWTPEYYKIAAAWPLLRERLRDKTVLDPFGGAGTMMHLLAARGIIKSGSLTDISYPDFNGHAVPVDDEGHFYAMDANRQIARALFDELPSWYRPDLDIIKEYSYADAKSLPFADNTFDYIVSDPPYSLNHESGGLGLTIGCLPEFERVSTEGTILMVPMKSLRTPDWAAEIEQAGFPVVRLTEDVSKGNSGIPLRYIHVLHRNIHAARHRKITEELTG